MAVVPGWRHRVRLLSRRAGIDLARYPVELPDYGLYRALAATAPDVVLDVGANAGQFARELRAWGYAGRIVSVEPVTAVHRELAAAAAGDPAWTTVHAAVAPEAGEITINVAANHAASSSALPMLGTHEQAAPDATYVGTEVAPAITLDDLVDSHCRPDERVFLKLDLQGFEGAALAGLDRGWPRLCGVRCELSLVPLYDGGLLWDRMVALFDAHGLGLVDLAAGFRAPTTHQLLQFDGVFARAAHTDHEGESNDGE